MIPIHPNSSTPVGQTQTSHEIKEIVFAEQALKVLDENQRELKSLLEDFSTTHFLAGGTAIALYLGHRKSIDFDFFCDGTVGNFSDFVGRIGKYGFDVSPHDKKNFAGCEFDPQDEIHVEVLGVRISLINYYRTLYDDQKISIRGVQCILGGLKIASMEELACMKLFAMISRKKWKDAVDLYFLIHATQTTLQDLLQRAQTQYFINIFNKEAILEQLISRDWDKTENVIYLIDEPPEDHEIENFLEKEALNILKR